MTKLEYNKTDLIKAFLEYKNVGAFYYNLD